MFYIPSLRQSIASLMLVYRNTSKSFSMAVAALEKEGKLRFFSLTMNLFLRRRTLWTRKIVNETHTDTNNRLLTTTRK
jgi:hypothetical protein